MTPDDLILIRLLAAGAKGEPASKVRKDLASIVPAGADMAIDRQVAEAESAGWVVRLAGKNRGSTPRFVLSETGRARALSALGVQELRPRTTWATIRKTYLPAAALGIPAASESTFKAMSSDPVVRAVLLRRQFSLPTAEVPKLDEAIDALAWKLIGFEGESRKFDVKTVKSAILTRALGDGRNTEFRKAAARLAARGAGAGRDDGKTLRDAIVRGRIKPGVPTAEEPPPAHAPKPPSLNPAEIADRAKAAARDCPTGRHGDRKVFIAHVWDRLRSEPEFAGIDLDTFKQAIAEANNLRLIDLARADLVQAMDPDDVRRSEVGHLGATFHFIRL